MLTQCLDVTCRAATAADEQFRRTLFAQSRDELLLLPADVRDTLVDMQYRAQRQQFAADHPAAQHRILVAAGADVGQLIVDHGAERVHVVDIAVARAQRRRGIASQALRHVLDDAAGRSVTLCVWHANTVARTLYERLGFVVSGTENGYLAMACGSLA